MPNPIFMKLENIGFKAKPIYIVETSGIRLQLQLVAFPLNKQHGCAVPKKLKKSSLFFFFFFSISRSLTFRFFVFAAVVSPIEGNPKLA